MPSLIENLLWHDLSQVLVSRCSSVEVGTDQEVDAEEANASHPPYLTPTAASVTMASSISLLNKLVMFSVYYF